MTPLEYTWLRFVSWFYELAFIIAFVIALFIVLYIISKVKPEWL